jgi:capsid portal protein
MKKRTYKNKHTASSGSAGQPDISDALRSDPALSAFTFDGPYSVTDGYDLLDSMCCVDNGRYYETPIDWKGLTRAFAQSPLHQSALYFKRNVLTGCYIPHPLLSRQAFSAFALDWFVFGNAYLERRSNRLGAPLKLQHVPALNTRRGSDLDTYWFIRQWKDEYEFKPGRSATS